MNHLLKYILIAFGAVFVLAACHDDELYRYKGDGERTAEEVRAITQRLSTVEAVHIDVPTGQLAVIRNIASNDTIALLPASCDIMLPVNDLEDTRAEGGKSYDVTYITASTVKLNPNQQFIYDSYFTVAFEDSKTLDYDYNDLVLNICLDNRAPRSTDKVTDFKARLLVKPIALGGEKKVGFGIRMKDGTEVVLTEDVRRDYFQGKQGFLNTSATQIGVMQFPVKEVFTQNEWLGELYFFILADGERRYAVNSQQNDRVIDKNGCPYGIVVNTVTGNRDVFAKKLTPEDKAAFTDHPSQSINYMLKTDTWWYYPLEQVPIDEVYTYAPYHKPAYAGTFDWIIKGEKSLKELCYYNRANKSKAFPIVAFDEDGNVDAANSIYYTRFVEKQ